MPGRLIACLLALAILSIDVNPSFAQTSVTISAEMQFQYAQQLFSQKKYMIAIAEYERFVHLFPADGRVPEARFHMAMAYYFERRYPEAIQTFRELSESVDRQSVYYARSFFMAAESQQRLGQRTAALTTLRNLGALSKDMAVRDEAHYRMGWIFLETYEWETAQRYFEKISQEQQAKYRLADLIGNLERTGDIQHKRPGNGRRSGHYTRGRVSLLQPAPGCPDLFCVERRPHLCGLRSLRQ